MRKLSGVVALGSAAFLVVSLFAYLNDGEPALYAQTSTKASTKALETRAQKAEAAFVGEMTDLATSFEKAGDLEQAKKMLQAVARVGGQNPALQQRIDKLNEQLLSQNLIDTAIDVSGDWGKPIAKVTNGQKFRVQAAGQYRFQVMTNVEPDGFPTADPTTDMAPDIPCGALMGMVVAGNRPDKPFLIGKEVEFIPKRDGLLFVRVNVPQGHRCTGKVAVRLGGYVEAP